MASKTKKSRANPSTNTVAVTPEPLPADEAAQLTRPQPELGELLAPEAAPASHRRRTAG